ncbi:MAG: ElyC/SanA/YdcF family protein [Planctomycetota bacterium]
MKTGVLIHGCNLRAENWRHIAWGDPPKSMGRIPQGLLTAYMMDAPVIVFGSGASSKFFRYRNSPRTNHELVESEYTVEYLRAQFDNLRNFKPWAERVPETRCDKAWEELQKELFSRIVMDTNSLNTVGEINNAANLFLKHEVERVVLVSSPTHIVRVLRDANTILLNDIRFEPMRYNVHAVPCVTCYEGSTSSDVVVIEPPHRPDRHVLPTHRRIQRMLSLQKLDTDDLMRLINDFDELLQQYEEIYFNEYLPRPQAGMSQSVSVNRKTSGESTKENEVPELAETLILPGNTNLPVAPATGAGT